jgi:hypothetical protein
MTDPVTLLVPADVRFRGLAPDVGGRYVVAAGGSEADAGVVVSALNAAIDALTAGVPDSAGVELNFRTPDGPDGPDGLVEVTVLCEGKSSVVTHPLPAAKA